MRKFLLVVGLLFSFTASSSASELPPHRGSCDQKAKFSLFVANQCSSGQVIMVEPVGAIICDYRYSITSFVFSGREVVSCVKR